MNFILKTSLGLLVLCSFVWSSPVDTLKPVEPSLNNQTIGHDANGTTIVTVPKANEEPTRSPSNPTAPPTLNHSSVPSEVPESSSSPVESHGPEHTAEKAEKDKLKENDKSSASVHIQIYPLALTSVAVLLFSAI